MTTNTAYDVNPEQPDSSWRAVDAQTNVITDGHTVYLVFQKKVSTLVSPEIIEADRIQERRESEAAATVTHHVFRGILTPLLLGSRSGEEGSRPAS